MRRRLLLPLAGLLPVAALVALGFWIDNGSNESRNHGCDGAPLNSVDELLDRAFQHADQIESFRLVSTLHVSDKQRPGQEWVSFADVYRYADGTSRGTYRSMAGRDMERFDDADGTVYVRLSPGAPWKTWQDAFGGGEQADTGEEPDRGPRWDCRPTSVALVSGPDLPIIQIRQTFKSRQKLVSDYTSDLFLERETLTMFKRTNTWSEREKHGPQATEYDYFQVCEFSEFVYKQGAF